MTRTLSIHPWLICNWIDPVNPVQPVKNSVCISDCSSRCLCVSVISVLILNGIRSESLRQGNAFDVQTALLSSAEGFGFVGSGDEHFSIPAGALVSADDLEAAMARRGNDRG